MFLQDMLTFSRENGGGENILCLMAWDRSAGSDSFKPGYYGVLDWEPFLKLDNLDVLSTDPYWIHHSTFDFFKDNTIDAVKLAHKYGIKIWVMQALPDSRRY